VSDFFEPFEVGTGQTMKNLLDSLGIDEEYRLTDIIPIIRVIYDQEQDVNAFAGMVSLVPLFAENYSVTGGNSLLVEKLFKASGAHVMLQTTAQSVTKLSEGNYQIKYNSNFGESQEARADIFDAVVIATPLESSRGLDFSNIPAFNFTMREYKQWYVTYVSADGLNPTFFGINPVPSEILTTTGGDNLPFVVLSEEDTLSTGKKLYKTFSTSPLDPNSSMYLNPDPPVVQFWPKTFPSLKPVPSYQPLLLDENVYYLNCMESAATAMEASALAGRNVALLYSQKL